MTVFKTAYDTTICQGFVNTVHKTAQALQVAEINGSLVTPPNQSAIRYVQGGTPAADAIPAFAHPMLFKGQGGQDLIGVDLRAVGRWDPHQNQFVVRNAIEYALLTRRAQLTEVWLGVSGTTLKSLSNLPVTIFSSWLSESIARRFALDAREQLDLAILAAVFYNSQFTDEKILTDDEKNRTAGQIARITRASAEDVFKVMDHVSVVQDLKGFCAMAMDVTGSVRLKDLNAGLVYEILGGTWWGLNAREVIAVAVEHPPTWISVLLAAYNERTFKNSGITKITERPSNKDNGGNFLRSVLNLVDSAV